MTLSNLLLRKEALKHNMLVVSSTKFCFLLRLNFALLKLNTLNRRSPLRDDKLKSINKQALYAVFRHSIIITSNMEITSKQDNNNMGFKQYCFPNSYSTRVFNL